MNDWDELSPLEIDNQRLREELDAAKRAAAAYEAWKFPEDIQALTLANERLREEVARLREALKPFAAIMVGERKPEFAGAKDSEWTRCFVTIGDLRAAAAAIREGGRGG